MYSVPVHVHVHVQRQYVDLYLGSEAGVTSTEPKLDLRIVCVHSEVCPLLYCEALCSYQTLDQCWKDNLQPGEREGRREGGREVEGERGVIHFASLTYRD